jgi:hypothetical protein
MVFHIEQARKWRGAFLGCVRGVCALLISNFTCKTGTRGALNVTGQNGS